MAVPGGATSMPSSASWTVTEFVVAETKTPGAAAGRAHARAVRGLDDRRPDLASQPGDGTDDLRVSADRPGPAALGMSRLGLRTTRAPALTKAPMPPSGSRTARTARVDRRRLVCGEPLNGRHGVERLTAAAARLRLVRHHASVTLGSATAPRDRDTSRNTRYHREPERANDGFDPAGTTARREDVAVGPVSHKGIAAVHHE